MRSQAESSLKLLLRHLQGKLEDLATHRRAQKTQFCSLLPPEVILRDVGHRSQKVPLGARPLQLNAFRSRSTSC
jgi:hypothetical protein